jgi:hypothetical protein
MNDPLHLMCLVQLVNRPIQQTDIVIIGYFELRPGKE